MCVWSVCVLVFCAHAHDATWSAIIADPTSSQCALSEPQRIWLNSTHAKPRTTTHTSQVLQSSPDIKPFKRFTMFSGFANTNRNSDTHSRKIQSLHPMCEFIGLQCKSQTVSCSTPNVCLAELMSWLAWSHGEIFSILILATSWGSFTFFFFFYSF